MKRVKDENKIEKLHGGSSAQLSSIFHWNGNNTSIYKQIIKLTTNALTLKIYH